MASDIFEIFIRSNRPDSNNQPDNNPLLTAGHYVFIINMYEATSYFLSAKAPLWKQKLWVQDQGDVGGESCIVLS